MLEKLTTLMVHVSDMDRSLAFYRDVLGLPLQVEGEVWSQFDLGSGTILGLHAGGKPAEASGWTPGFSVTNIAASRRALLAADVKVVRDFHDIPGGVTIGLLDPDGNGIDLTQMGTSCAELGVICA